MRGWTASTPRDTSAGDAHHGRQGELLLVDADSGEVRSGLADELVHPETGRPAGAVHVVAALVGHLSAARSESGDVDTVKDVLAALLDRGNGPVAQRETFTRTNDLGAVVLEAVTDGAGHEEAPGSVLGARPDQWR